MKPLISMLCFLFCGAFVSAQTFEGKVIYHDTYTSRTPGTADNQYSAMAGTIQHYYIKGGNYKSETNGTLVLWQLYINKDNKIYSKIAHSANILWDDAAVNPDKVTSVELHKGVANILGYKCDELVLHSESNFQKYYFSSQLPVDSKLYKKHLYGNWYAYLAKANALPLKTIIRNEKFIMESTATEVKPMKLDDSFFTLPQGSKTEKSMF